MKKPSLKVVNMMLVVAIAFLVYLATVPGATDGLVHWISTSSPESNVPAGSHASLSKKRLQPTQVKQPIKVYGEVLDGDEFGLILTGRRVDQEKREVFLDVDIIEGPASSPRTGYVWLKYFDIGSFIVQLYYNDSPVYYQLSSGHRLHRYVVENWLYTPSLEASEPFTTDWKEFRQGATYGRLDKK